jgi:1-acyl-sn-glycerol-3-phosphate acyltransferase
MRKILGWVLTPLYLLSFLWTICFFHLLQFLGKHLIGYQAQKRAADFMGWFILYGLRLVGTSISLPALPNLPKDKPLLVISNHQSMFDIGVLVTLFAPHHAKFVSKIELSRGIPGISYNLRHGGSVLIDRKNPQQALPALKDFAKFLSANNYCGCIFPEGTRAIDGKVKPFKVRGLSTLLQEMPDAVVLPVALDGLWELVQYNYLPIPAGCSVKATILEPIDRTGKTDDEVVAECEQKIRKQLGQLNDLPTAEKKK